MWQISKNASVMKASLSKPYPSFTSSLTYFSSLLLSFTILRILKSLVSLMSLYSRPIFASLAKSFKFSYEPLPEEPEDSRIEEKGMIANTSRKNQD